MKSQQPSNMRPCAHCSRGCLVTALLMTAAALSCSWFGLIWLRPLLQQRTSPLRLQLPAVLEPCAESSRRDYELITKAALEAPWSSNVPFNRTMRMPQQLWQTSKSNILSERASKLQNSWRSLNPSLNITLMNDTEAAGFISNFYGQEVAALYRAYPLGVMRADFWRYAILYAYGGVYSDIDTECLQPLAQWFPPKPRAPEASKAPPFVSENSTWRSAGDLQYDTLTWDDCSMVVALENDAHMCQWTFAAVAGHPVLRSTLKMAVKSLEQGVQCMYDHMVHAHTGPGTWTEGLRDALGLPNSCSAADIARAVWTDAAAYQRAREMQLCVMAPEFFGGLMNNVASQNVRNHYSSQWQDSDAPNTPWIVEKAKLDESLKSAAAAIGTATD